MNTLPHDARPARAIRVKVTKDVLAVDLEDGRSVMVPIGWYPRLAHGTMQERSRWRLISSGEGIHWPDLDEDISVEGLLSGFPSGESQQSYKRWLAAREQKQPKSRGPRSAGARPQRASGRVPPKRARRG